MTNQLHFSYLSQEVGFEISCETICMKSESLFCGKNKKNIITLSSAEFVHSVQSVKKKYWFKFPTVSLKFIVMFYLWQVLF